MNFDDAIKSHSNWKMKLSTYIRNPDQSLKATEVGRDDVCQLGCWIHGDGRSFASLPEYAALKAAHDRFHKAAAEIVRKADAGETVSSDIALSATSPYAKTSMEVVQAIMAMKRKAA